MPAVSKRSMPMCVCVCVCVLLGGGNRGKEEEKCQSAPVEGQIVRENSVVDYGDLCRKKLQMISQIQLHCTFLLVTSSYAMRGALRTIHFPGELALLLQQ